MDDDCRERREDQEVQGKRGFKEEQDALKRSGIL